MGAGSILVVLFFVSFLTEICFLVLLAPRTLLGMWDMAAGERIGNEAREYNSRALTLAGLTFAGISLIYGTAQNPSLVAESLTVFVASLSFFLVSYSLTLLVRYRRLYWVAQDKSLAFGYLAMFAGVLVLMYERFPAAFVAAVVGFAFVAALHILELRGDARHWGEAETALGPSSPS
jgi:hypothetical protein